MKKRSDYKRIVGNDGTDIEIISYYEPEFNTLEVYRAPNHQEILEEVKKILKGTGISKISITFLDANL